MVRAPIAAIVIAFCLAALLPGTGGARTRGAALPVAATSQDAWQTETGLTSHPIGWEDFCRKNPATCRLHDERPGIVMLDAATWSLIVKTNIDVNAAITPLSDEEHWGVAESWDFPDDGYGDCEDYVLQKRRLLLQAGLPLAALMITVVRDLAGDGHAVLTVRTDRGDFILDNKRNRVLLWNDTGYSYIKRQANLNPMRWVSLGPASPSTAATAAR
ncbi:transglutaminase-like cysteine peptidase [Pseudochelatococcus sp. B33]